MAEETAVYSRQGFGNSLGLQAPFGLLIVDFVNSFADPAVFGGGNIAPAIAQTVKLLAHARKHGWPVAHSRIVFADDAADSNIFGLKVPGMVTLKGPGECLPRKPDSSAVMRPFIFSLSATTTTGMGSSELASTAPGPCQSGR